MPRAVSFSVALGPIPLILRAGRGQMRWGMSSWSSRVRPSGLSRSEQILASSLFGVMPMEQVRPVAANTASLMRRARDSLSPGTSVRSM